MSTIGNALTSLAFWSGVCTVLLCIVGVLSRWTTCVTAPPGDVSGLTARRRFRCWLGRITLMGWSSGTLLIALTVGSVLLSHWDSKRKGRAAASSLQELTSLRTLLSEQKEHTDRVLRAREGILKAGQLASEGVQEFCEEAELKLGAAIGTVREGEPEALPFLKLLKTQLTDREKRWSEAVVVMQGLGSNCDRFTRLQLKLRALIGDIDVRTAREEADRDPEYHVGDSRAFLERFRGLVGEFENRIQSRMCGAEGGVLP